jgi:hypothetical protein
MMTMAGGLQMVLWIENLLPQTYLVSLINTSDTNPIQKFYVAAGEPLPFNLRESQPMETVFVVSGSKLTRQKAQY